MAVGEALEHLYAAQLDELAAALAHHFGLAEAHEKALGYYLRAVEEYKAAKKSQKVDVRLMSAYASLVEVYKGLGLRLKAKEYQDLIDEMSGKEKE